MTKHILFSLASVLVWTRCLGASAGEVNTPVLLEVDVREAPRRILHAQLVFPVQPGRLTLWFPRWIPGTHSPSREIQNLAGLRMSAGNQPVAWQRDLEDMCAVHCEVPPQTSALEVHLDCLMATSTPKLAVLRWERLLLYPKGILPAKLEYRARLRLPPGWQQGSSLTVAATNAGVVEFRPVSLATLIDSPVLAGEHFKSLSLAADGAPHWLHLAADSAAALEVPAATLAAYRQLVPQTQTLFGARPYDQYHFLLALSDRLPQGGLEHHESSDNRVAERAFLDPVAFDGMAALLPHEFAHSWNGKYRRPVGLTTQNYQQPMQGDLLWVYEGLTSYLGYVLTARSGLWTCEKACQRLANMAAEMEHTAGRNWRSLSDTAVAAPFLFDAPLSWRSWRRDVDFYPEGALLWLEVDVLIRQQTGGQRSLDDFCRLFFGGVDGLPAVTPYTLEDVLTGLNKIAPRDWRMLLTTRLDTIQQRVPLAGLEQAGWRLVYREQPHPSAVGPRESQKMLDLTVSLGLRLNSEGVVVDVVPDLAAAQAGLAPEMKLLGVNGRKFSPDALRQAVQASKSSTEPLELLAENGDFYRVYRLDYHGGARYPALERDATIPDLLSAIFRPVVAPAVASPTQ